MSTNNIFDRSFHIKRAHKAINIANEDKLISYVSNNLIERISLISDTFNIKVKSVLLVGFTNILLDHFNNIDVTNLAYIDEEKPISADKFDLIISNLSAHMVNDIKYTFTQYKNMLNENGFFICTIFGGNTLYAMREFLLNTELKISNGASPRIIPFITVKDAGMLLQMAGFKNVISDSEDVEIVYKSAIDAARHLQKIGQSNCLSLRKKGPMPKQLFYALQNKQDFSSNFDIITLTAGI